MLWLLVSLALAAKELTPQEQYEQGVKYMKRGYYVKALEEFNRLRNYHRDDPYSVLAELAIADLHYEKAEWDLARVAYEDFLRLHPRHDKADYTVYRLGMTSWEKAPRIAARDQTWTRHAVAVWSNFDQRFPGSEYSDEVAEHLGEARDRLAHKEFIIGRFYFEEREAWLGVIGRLEGLLATYPNSPDVPMALAMLVIAYGEVGEAQKATQAEALLNQRADAEDALRWLERHR